MTGWTGGFVDAGHMTFKCSCGDVFESDFEDYKPAIKQANDFGWKITVWQPNGEPAPRSFLCSCPACAEIPYS